MEVAKEQLRDGRHFYLEADLHSPLWSDPAWREVAANPEIVTQLSRTGARRIATSSTWMSLREGQGWEMPTKAKTPSWVTGWDQLSDGEKMAYHLRAQGDFSNAACVRLLECTKWPRQRKKRISLQDPRVYQVLGQYSYGNFSGVTLSTYKLRYTFISTTT